MRDRYWIGGRLLVAIVPLITLLHPACGGSSDDVAGDRGGTNSGGSGGSISIGDGSSSGGSGGCTNLECDIVTCGGGVTTNVTGTVYDPSGTLPLYNVVVYVPNSPLKPIENGATCDQCGKLSGDPIVTAITDTKGQFVLKDVPAGDSIPLVIQIGKWRRQITLPKVEACKDNPIADATETRLPAKKSEGDMPRIALTTGGADALECLLRKIGIDDSEFTPESGDGKVNFYAGEGGTDQYDSSMNGGAQFTNAQQLWGDVGTLQQYDIVLLSCEGGQNPETKPAGALSALRDYSHAGGRVFASHWHNYWFEAGPTPWPDVATFNHQSDIGQITADIDMSFPKGQAMAEWLLNNGGSTVLGQIDLNDTQHTVDAENPTLSQRWIYSNSPNSVQYLSANTPMGAAPETQCGRVVLSDIHVSTGDQSSTDTQFPNGCTSQGLTPQEKALIFMLFDLSSCIVPDDEPPVPPPVQ